MPLSPPDGRKHLHRRTYQMDGFIRDDGLWDIEGHIRDVKTYAFENAYRGTIGPDDPIHDMSLRLTIDDSFEIKAIEAVTDGSPYAVCPAITPNFQKMVGARIGPGWRRTVRERLGGIHGCTHLVELLISMATVAYQTAYSSRSQTGKQKTAVTPRPGKRPALLNSCHAYREDGPIVARQFPDFYTGSTPTSD